VRMKEGTRGPKRSYLVSHLSLGGDFHAREKKAELIGARGEKGQCATKREEGKASEKEADNIGAKSMTQKKKKKKKKPTIPQPKKKKTTKPKGGSCPHSRDELVPSFTNKNGRRLRRLQGEPRMRRQY